MTTKINIVLLVDDSTIFSSRLVSMLEDSNNTQVVLQASNYTDALQIMETFKPDYVLIDIGLSGKTGMSLLEEVKNNQQQHQSNCSPKYPFNSLANKQYRNFCESMGVNYFLDKTNEFEKIPQILSGAQLN